MRSPEYDVMLVFSADFLQIFFREMALDGTGGVKSKCQYFWGEKMFVLHGIL